MKSIQDIIYNNTVNYSPGDDDDGPILDTLILNHFAEVERYTI